MCSRCRQRLTLRQVRRAGSEYWAHPPHVADCGLPCAATGPDHHTSIDNCEACRRSRPPKTIINERDKDGDIRALYEIAHPWGCSWVIASCHVWMPGSYASEEAARLAFEFNDETLVRMQKELNATYHLPEVINDITLDMLKEEQASDRRWQAWTSKDFE